MVTEWKYAYQMNEVNVSRSLFQFSLINNVDFLLKNAFFTIR